MTKYIKILFWISIFHFSFFIFHGSAHANTVSLSVYPAVSVIGYPQSASAAASIKATSTSNSATDFSISFAPIEQGTDGTLSLLPTDSRYKTLFRNIHVLINGQEQEYVTLKPDETKTLTVRMDNIPNRSDYYFAVLLGSSEQTTSDNKKITAVATIIPTLGAVILLTPEQAKTNAILQQLLAPTIARSTPATLHASITNQSAHVAVLSAYVTVEGIPELRSQTISFDPVIVLGKHTRTLTKSFPGCENQAGSTTITWCSRFPFGVYTATLRTTSNGQVIGASAKTFVLAPLLTAIFLCIVVGFILLIGMRVKKYLS